VQPYSDEVSEQIEAAFRRDQKSSCAIVIDQLPFVVDFDSMTQRGPKGGIRKVLRQQH
jgi:hypothetical protein